MAKFAIRSNRKFRRLVGMLRLDSPCHVKSHLDALWEGTWDELTPLIGDLQDIESLAGWLEIPNKEKYPTGALAAALVMTGFVDTIVEGSLYAVHDWYEHALPGVRRKVSLKAKEDPTVCAETFYLGLDAWRKRAASIGLILDEPKEPVSRFPSEPEGSTGDSVDKSDPRTPIRSTKPDSQPGFVVPSCLVLSGQVGSGPPAISPPSSPPSLFRPQPEVAVKPLSPLPPSPDEAELRPVIGRVTDAVVHLIAVGDEESADLLEDQALTCRSVGDWTALAQIATEALQRSTRQAVPA